jgi:hypothetical protein
VVKREEEKKETVKNNYTTRIFVPLKKPYLARSFSQVDSNASMVSTGVGIHRSVAPCSRRIGA